MRTNAKFIYSVLAGAAVGALVGYLFTTEKGKHLRSAIGEAVREGTDMIVERTSDISSRFRTRTEDIADELKGGLEKAKSRGSKYFEKTGLGNR